MAKKWKKFESVLKAKTKQREKAEYQYFNTEELQRIEEALKQSTRN